jgi:hypothetical protein
MPRAIPPWEGPLQAMERALREQRRGAAAQAWEEAHRAALDDPGWEGLLQAGHGRLRLDEVNRELADGWAITRRLYSAALFRASRSRDPDGILAVAAAFGRLGDRDVVAECLALVTVLPRSDGAQSRLRALLGPGSTPREAGA